MGKRNPSACLMQWPGKIESRLVVNKAVSALDIYPTLLSLACIEPCAQKFDGENIEDVLLKNAMLP